VTRLWRELMARPPWRELAVRLQRAVARADRAAALARAGGPAAAGRGASWWRGRPGAVRPFRGFCPDNPAGSAGQVALPHLARWLVRRGGPRRVRESGLSSLQHRSYQTL